MAIKETTTINEAIKMSKGVLEVLKKHNLYCASCKAQQQDSIQHVASNNGLDVKVFLNELNKAL